MARPEHVGAKMGPRLAGLMARAATHHLRQSAHLRAKIGRHAADMFMEGVGDEARGNIGLLFAELAEDGELPDYARELFWFAAHGRGEWQALLSYGVGATSFSTTLSGIIANSIAPTVEKFYAAHPNQVLAPTVLADLLARGIVDQDYAIGEAAKSAVSSHRFGLLANLAFQRLDLATVLELVRRGRMNLDDAAGALRFAGVPPHQIDDLLSLRRVHLSPEMAADMVLKGHLGDQEGRAIAAAQGVDERDFELLVADTGEPPGTQELLFAYRRGIIGRDRLERGIRQSRVRNEWIDVLESLRFVPMDTSDAIRAAVQGHLSEADARHVAEVNGLRSQDFAPLLATAGEPIARGEALELFNRGQMSQARLEQAIRESRVKNKYIPDIVHLRRRLIPERTVVSMIGHKVLTHREGVTHLLDLGFDHTDAEALVQQGAHTNTSHERNLAKGEIVELYEDHALSRDSAHTMIVDLGYSKHEADLILELAALRRDKAAQKAAVNVVRSQLVSRHISEDQASADLDHLGVPPAQRDHLLNLWELEVRGHTRQLTEAQVIHAMKKQVIDAQDAHDRLTGMGYSQTDAAILLHLAGA